MQKFPAQKSTLKYRRASASILLIYINIVALDIIILRSSDKNELLAKILIKFFKNCTKMTIACWVFVRQNFPGLGFFFWGGGSQQGNFVVQRRRRGLTSCNFPRKGRKGQSGVKKPRFFTPNWRSELSLCHKLWFSNPYLPTLCRRP